MLKIADMAALARALDSPLDRVLRELLRQRCDQLLADTGGDYDLGDLAEFLVVEPHDAVADVEAAAGYPVVTKPAFEWVADHGGWYEAVTILSDDGFGIVLFVPHSDGVDPSLLALLRDLARPPTSDGSVAGQERRSFTP
ncbi:hypothetical protein NS277_04750 [Novosphingobium barchaimii]|nr:hypothetical protein NS277_04750 [Novosphingobium barchaimii]